jgi:ATP-binding cassette, subfamily B, bacterial
VVDSGQPKTKPAWWRPASFRFIWSQFPKIFTLVFDADRRIAILIATLALLGGLLPLPMAWIGKLIIDGVISAAETGGDVSPVLQLVGIEVGLMIVSAACSRGFGLCRSLLGARLAYDINGRILAKAMELELADFENPELYDQLQNARREASSRPLNVYVKMIGLLRDGITLISYAGLLALFSPWAVLVLVLATLPVLYSETKFSGEAFQLFSWRAPQGRKMKYFEWLLTRDSSVKEVKLYGLGQWILSRYRKLYETFYAEEKDLAIRRAVMGFLLGVLSTIAFYGCYAWIVVRTVEGHLSLGEMTMYLTVFRQGQSSLRSILGAVSGLYEDHLFMSNLFRFFAIPTQTFPPFVAPDESSRTRGGICLEDVSFRYPGQKEWALRNINIEINPDENVAIIGDNGAGKTTLIKLITGLYRPTEGRILIGGEDISKMHPEALRRKLGVVLQDFVRYHFRARDNVGLGQVSALEDLPRIEKAVEQGGAEEVVASLSEGYETQLGRWFEGGAELSAGQWQKLAVSRAFMRDADVLILDEPTASLDAEAEYGLFQRFQTLTEGKISILISHRFSTVRMADRILVLRAGKVEEFGNHQELLALDGRYAHLFRLQAQGYLDAFA